MTTPIEKNKLDNIDLLQMEYFLDLDISKKDIVVIEPNDSIAITLHKFLVNLGFENICICKDSDEGIKIFSEFIKDEINVPIIIDSGISEEDVENATKEILEIYSSANILVITAKEKTDSQIVKLCDMGIASVIQKPLNFDNLKKSLSDVFGRYKDTEKMELKNFESLITLYNKISKKRIKDVLNLEQTDVEALIKNATESKIAVFDKEILEAACNQCGSTNITYISECPQCKGINFKQQNLIEHYRCGEVFPKEPNSNTCPKCNKDIGSVGRDFREFLDYHVCSSCNDKFPRPLFKFVCFDCGNEFIERIATWTKSKTYRIQK